MTAVFLWCRPWPAHLPNRSLKRYWVASCESRVKPAQPEVGGSRRVSRARSGALGHRQHRIETVWSGRVERANVGRPDGPQHKLHLALDADTGELVASVLTGNDLDDAGQTPVLLEQVDAEIKNVRRTAPMMESRSTRPSRADKSIRGRTSSSRRAHPRPIDRG